VVKPHILLVDDEEAVRQISAQMLEMLGYRVSAAEDGPTALELFRAGDGRFDLALLDINLPGMSGRQLLSELRAIRPELKAVFCHGDGNLSPLADDPPHLLKPYRMAELKRLIEELLAG
jgi:CheY-like chemotaxis protein